MSVLNTILSELWIGTVFVFNTTIYWLSLLFYVPFTKPELLWVLVPIWVNLIFTDFFQEKHSTKLGNAITNGAIAIWVGIDWTRHLTEIFESFTMLFIIKLLICLFMIFFGVFIIVQGIKGKEYVRLIARVRETSYLQLMFTLLIYGAIDLSLKFILVVLIYLPIFYLIFELIDKYTPDLISEEGSSNLEKEFKF
jgi:hypothetical protein